MKRRRWLATPLSREYRLLEGAAERIWGLASERSLTEKEIEAARKMDDEAAALRDLEREQAE